MTIHRLTRLTCAMKLIIDGGKYDRGRHTKNIKEVIGGITKQQLVKC